MPGDERGQLVVAFIRKVAPFAYCDACLALRLGTSLHEMTATLAALADSLTRTRRACYGCGRILELSGLRDGPPPR